MPRRTKEEAEQTRQLLLDMALRLFAEQGIHATSLKQVAASSGHTHGALYWHFKNRTDLVAALYHEYRLDLDDLYLDQLQSSRQNALEGLYEYMVGWCLQVLQDEKSRAIWQVFHQGDHALPELSALYDDVAAEHDRWLKVLRKIIRKARKQDLLKHGLHEEKGALAEAALAAIMGTIAYLTISQQQSGNLLSDKKLIKQVKNQLKYFKAGLEQ